VIANLVRRLPRPLRVPLRAAGIHTGRHRGPRAVPGAIVGQRFVHCPVCKVETAATIHGSLLRCTEGHLVEGVA
jgi:hypothetical protein